MKITIEIMHKTFTNIKKVDKENVHKRNYK